MVNFTISATPYPYAYNMTGFDSILAYDNGITGGMFTILTIVSIWVIFFLSYSRFSTEQRSVVASFLTMIATIIMSVIDPATVKLIPVSIVVLLVSLWLNSFKE